jgi:MFS family permease
VRASLRPVAASFLAFGCFAGSWSVAAVDVEHTFGLTDAGLGVVLGIAILCGTASAAFGGVLTDRWGARLALTRALLVWAAFLAAAALAPHVAAFVALLTLAIAAQGLLDVVMNVIAADELADEPGRLVRFHGLFNAAAVFGAIATGVVLQLDGSWRIVWVAIAVVALAVAATARRAPVHNVAHVANESMWRSLVALRHEGVVVLALVFAAAAMVEGGIAIWGVLYLRGHLGVSVFAGVGAYVVGQSLATMTRFGGSHIVGALGTRRAVAIGAGLAAFGLAAEVVSTNAAVAATGLAVAAVGISVVWPLLIAEVNNEARHPAVAIGGITAAGYLGMVAGPPLVGAISALFGLRAALGVLAALAFFVAITPARVRASVR